VAAALLGPVRLVEPLAQGLRLGLEPQRERGVAPDLPGQLGRAAFRVVDVALHLARGDRRARDAAVVEALRVAGVLPALVLEPARGAPLVLDEPVAVAVAVLVDPGERAQRRLLQVADARRVIRPAPDLREQDEVERRRVGRAVVPGEPGLRSLAVADLVDDLAGL